MESLKLNYYLQRLSDKAFLQITLETERALSYVIFVRGNDINDEAILLTVTMLCPFLHFNTKRIGVIKTK